MGALPHFGERDTAVVYDLELEDHLFVGIGSQPLGDVPIEEWQRSFFETEGCAARTSILVDGQEGLIATDCDLAVVAAGGRGYILGLWSSSDDPQLLELDTRELFEAVLATVQLQPEDATS